MPTDAPAVKLAATRGYGAEVVTYDRDARGPGRDRRPARARSGVPR
jgi:threo-3-hydroxy-L-aspartate ammonia-lyase